MCTLANSEDPDETPHDVAFHQGLHCLLRQNDLHRKKYIYFVNITCDPSFIQWTISSLLYQIRRKNPLVHKGLIKLTHS